MRFAQDGRSRWCYLAAAAMGLAFNVKLFEGLVGLPALALFGVLVCRERRLVRLAGSAAVFVAVALSWLTMTLVLPELRPPLRDRLDQRQCMERDVRLQRLRPHRRRRDRSPS